MVLAWVMAGTTSPDASNPLVAYGLLGVILVAFTVLLVSGKFVVGREHDRVVQENQELRQRLPETITNQTLSTEALKETAKVLRDVLVVLEVRKQTGS